MQKSVEDIMRRIAEKNNVSIELVKFIWTAEWRYAAQRIRQAKRGNYSSFKFVYLPGLMRFYTSERKIVKLKAISDHIENKKQEAIKNWKEKKLQDNSNTGKI